MRLIVAICGTLTHSQATPHFFRIGSRLDSRKTFFFVLEVNGKLFFLRLTKLFFLFRQFVNRSRPAIERRNIRLRFLLPFQIYSDLPGPHSQEDDNGTDYYFPNHEITFHILPVSIAGYKLYNILARPFSGKGVVLMKIKYINYKSRRVYALYYANCKTMYYNLRFNGRTKMYLLIW